MDQLTALRSLGADSPAPSAAALAEGRARLAARAAAAASASASATTATSAPSATPQADGAHLAPPRRRRRATRTGAPRHPVRRAFLALGGVVAAVIVAAIVLTDALGIGAWQQNGISSSSTPAPSAAPLVFTLPDDCAALVDPSILADWSARYGDAPLVGQIGYPMNTEGKPAGRNCAYGSTDTASPRFTVSVTVLSPGDRASLETGLKGEGLQAESSADGSAVFTSDTPDAAGAVAQLWLVTDEASTAIQASGVAATDSPGLVALFADWMPRITARLSAPAGATTVPTTDDGRKGTALQSPYTTPTAIAPQGTAPTEFTMPTDCEGVVGPSILQQWAPRFGSADPVPELSDGEGDGFHDLDSDAMGRKCVYGSNPLGKFVTIIVGTIDSSPDGRERAEAQQRDLAAAEQPYGNGNLFTEPLGRAPTTVTMTLVTDTTTVTVGVYGTEQPAAEMLPYVRAWLDDVVARTGANL